MRTLLLLCTAACLLTLKSFSQNHKFEISMSVSSDFDIQKIIIAPKIIRKGFEQFYQFKLDTSSNVFDFGARFGFSKSSYQITVLPTNVLQGSFDYPIPLTFQYFNANTEEVESTSIFFLDSGNHYLHLPRNINDFIIKMPSPINVEYANFKEMFVGLHPPVNDDLSSYRIYLKQKHKIIEGYIKENPNSYVALWEIISDYTQYNYHPVYLENLKVFSNEFQRVPLLSEFRKKLEIEAAISVGGIFPAITLGKAKVISSKSFEKFDITLIDYWSTTCIPCIKSLPKMVAIYNKYKGRLNIISIADESSTKRMALANNILQKNKVVWPNYFDSKRVFREKVNASMYPLYFLVNRQGRIIERIEGNFDSVAKSIDKLLEPNTN